MIDKRIKEMRELMKDRNISFIAATINESHQTVWRFARKGENVNLNTIIKLDNYLQGANSNGES